jgi:hypothetical protein
VAVLIGLGTLIVVSASIWAFWLGVTGHDDGLLFFVLVATIGVTMFCTSMVRIVYESRMEDSQNPKGGEH